MKYELAAYDEGRFIVSSSVNNFKAEETKTIGVSIAPILRYRDNTDYVGISMHIILGEEKTPMIDFLFTLTYWVEGFEEFAKAGHSKQELINYTKELLANALGFARGAMAEKCINNPLSHIFLPNIPVEHLLPKVRIVKESAPEE